MHRSSYDLITTIIKTMKKLKILLFLCVVACTLTVQAQKQFTLNSPDGKLQTTITVGDKLTYDIHCDGRQILASSPISMTLENGEVWGEKAKLAGTSGKKVDQMVPSPFYRANELRDYYNELTLRFKKDWNVEFRAYNDGIAYRFVSRSKKPFNVVDETVDYRFPSDMVASVPYVKAGKDGDYESQYFNSFENTYTTDRLSKLNKKRLMFLPLVVDAGEGVKICITESGLENYPGLYLSAGVDFITGVNNPTYKAYIDFASANGIEYVILDEGWAVNLQADLMQVVKDINLKELVDYAASKNVGIILWAGYYAFDRDMENVCRYFADMGVKGFKVDFMDRDDQYMTAFNYRAAEMCAKYKLILDLHGTHKPAGLNRTYPNVLNFEGVNGLEQMKWSPASVDQVKYDVLLPFTRQVSGPMDYTQGAMRNASKGNYYPCNSEPMSQGTRCRQLALYVVFESPFNMLCDAPSNYMRELESTEFIANIPTVWDESIVLDGKMGEYIVTARRAGNVWYVGGITDWTARDIEVDCSFLGDKTYDATLFKDGVNAHRVGRDYKCESFRIKNDSKLKIHLAPGGGFALKIK